MRQRRIGGIDIDGRNVQLKSRMRLLEIKAANPFHVADEWNQLKLNVDPVAPFSFSQYEFLVLDRESCATDSSGSMETVNGSSVGGDPLRKVLSGPINFALTCESCTSTGIICPPSTSARGGHGVVGIKRECAVAAAQIGCAHA